MGPALKRTRPGNQRQRQMIAETHLAAGLADGNHRVGLRIGFQHVSAFADTA
jgi:hypothetical protein